MWEAEIERTCYSLLCYVYLTHAPLYCRRQLFKEREPEHLMLKDGHIHTLFAQGFTINWLIVKWGGGRLPKQLASQNPISNDLMLSKEIRTENSRM